jgi:predicted TIM-barrel fold metal-dependent hydrolase
MRSVRYQMLIDADGHAFFVVDDHTHVGTRSTPSQSVPGLTFDAHQLMAQMDAAGVDCAIAFPRARPTSDYRDQNEYLIECQNSFPDRIFAFARIQPLLGDQAVADVREYASLGVRGLKIHPIIDGGNHPVNSREVMFPVIEEAAKHGLVVLIHSGGYKTCTPTLIGDLADNFPRCAFIVGHSGIELYEDAIVVARRTDNVYLDASELAGPGLIRRLVTEVGADRVLFGSDAPARAIGWELGKIAKYAGLGPDDLEQVLGGNALRLLNFKPSSERRARVKLDDI